MPYDGCAGKSGDEIPDVVFEGALLLRSAGIAGGRAVGGDSSGVCDVAAGGVVAAGAVGDLPGIDRAVFVVGNEPFDAAVQVDEVGITHLTPASAALGNGGCVPPADIGGTHFAAGRLAVQWMTSLSSFAIIKKCERGWNRGDDRIRTGVDKVPPEETGEGSPFRIGSAKRRTSGRGDGFRFFRKSGERPMGVCKDNGRRPGIQIGGTSCGFSAA